MFTHVNVLTKEIIGSAMEVHRNLGPGLLESAYQQCLARELQLKDIPFRYEWPLPLDYKGLRMKCGYRVDILVADAVVVEAKAIEAIAPVHEAQLLTYMTGWLEGWITYKLQCAGVEEWYSQKSLRTRRINSAALCGPLRFLRIRAPF